MSDAAATGSRVLAAPIANPGEKNTVAERPVFDARRSVHDSHKEQEYYSVNSVWMYSRECSMLTL